MITLKFDTEICKRCNGEGRLEEFSHVAGGICAKCSGTRRQLSRKGSAASRAYESAMDTRCGKLVTDIKIGDVLAKDNMRVDAIEYREGGIYFTKITPGSKASVGFNPNRRVRLSLPDVADEVAEDIAARFPGVTLTN